MGFLLIKAAKRPVSDKLKVRGRCFCLARATWQKAPSEIKFAASVPALGKRTRHASPHRVVTVEVARTENTKPQVSILSVSRPRLACVEKVPRGFKRVQNIWAIVTQVLAKRYVEPSQDFSYPIHVEIISGAYPQLVTRLREKKV